MSRLSVQIVTQKGIPVSRDFLSEIVRRTDERMGIGLGRARLHEAMEGAINECVSELEAYAESLGPEHKGES